MEVSMQAKGNDLYKKMLLLEFSPAANEIQKECCCWSFLLQLTRYTKMLLLEFSPAANEIQKNVAAGVFSCS
jgi:hypothetical protein